LNQVSKSVKSFVLGFDRLSEKSTTLPVALGKRLDELRGEFITSTQINSESLDKVENSPEVATKLQTLARLMLLRNYLHKITTTDSNNNVINLKLLESPDALLKIVDSFLQGSAAERIAEHLRLCGKSNAAKTVSNKAEVTAAAPVIPQPAPQGASVAAISSTTPASSSEPSSSSANTTVTTPPEFVNQDINYQLTPWQLQNSFYLLYEPEILTVKNMWYQLLLQQFPLDEKSFKVTPKDIDNAVQKNIISNTFPAADKLTLKEYRQVIKNHLGNIEKYSKPYLLDKFELNLKSRCVFAWSDPSYKGFQAIDYENQTMTLDKLIATRRTLCPEGIIVAKSFTTDYIGNRRTFYYDKREFRKSCWKALLFFTTTVILDVIVTTM